MYGVVAVIFKVLVMPSDKWPLTAKIFKIIEEFFIKVKILIADFKSKKAVLKISTLKIIITLK